MEFSDDMAAGQMRILHEQQYLDDIPSDEADGICPPETVGHILRSHVEIVVNCFSR